MNFSKDDAVRLLTAAINSGRKKSPGEIGKKIEGRYVKGTLENLEKNIFQIETKDIAGIPFNKTTPHYDSIVEEIAGNLGFDASKVKNLDEEGFNTLINMVSTDDGFADNKYRTAYTQRVKNSTTNANKHKPVPKKNKKADAEFIQSLNDFYYGEEYTEQQVKEAAKEREQAYYQNRISDIRTEFESLSDEDQTLAIKYFNDTKNEVGRPKEYTGKRKKKRKEATEAYRQYRDARKKGYENLPDGVKKGVDLLKEKQRNNEILRDMANAQGVINNTQRDGIGINWKKVAFWGGLGATLGGAFVANKSENHYPNDY